MKLYTKKILQSSLFFLFLIPGLGHSRDVKKVHYYMGGGGEPSGETTIFDGNAKAMSRFIDKSSNWETSVSFNGGHSETEEIIKNKIPKAKNLGDFTEENYYSMVKEMIRKIESGELQAGDQLMVNIDTHGEKISKGGETTHHIRFTTATSKNSKNWRSLGTLGSLDSMKKLVELAGDKGVKLAIIDASCFSGNLLNIKNDKVCLISTTGTDQYGYSGTNSILSARSTFSGKLISNYKKGTNLEDAFLRARESSNLPDFPMISTPEGRAVNDLIYKMISPYLTYSYENLHDFKEMYATNSSEFENQVCQFNQNQKQLMDLLNQYEKLSSVSEEMNKKEFSKLRTALEDYRNYQLNYEKTLRAGFEVSAEIKEIILKVHPQQEKMLSTYKVVDFLQNDFDYPISQYQEFADRTVKESKDYWTQMLINAKEEKAVADVIKASLSESSRQKLKAMDEAYGKLGATRDLAARVGTEARKLYMALYKQEMKKTANNPCRDFVL